MIKQLQMKRLNIAENTQLKIYCLAGEPVQPLQIVCAPLVSQCLKRMGFTRKHVMN